MTDSHVRIHTMPPANWSYPKQEAFFSPSYSDAVREVFQRTKYSHYDERI